MAKHKKEIEVEFPDCDICGRDIGTEEYLELEINVARAHSQGDGVGVSFRSVSCLLSICDRCIPHLDIWKPKLLEVVAEAVNRKHP